jgi:hypothetical protein
MKQKMKIAILISLAFAIWISIGCKKKGAPPSASLKDCFTCNTVPAGTIFCDDFESET